ncbi:MAG: hypothetical protein KBA33_06515 [Cloacibacterium sp.]|nr:hypothetical protein [Cloacibacterium sp.]
MRKKAIIVTLLLFLATFILYFTLFRKDKNLYFVPENTDYVVLLDTKNIAKTYLYHSVLNPSEWLKKEKKEDKISLKNSGIKIPDFIQIFHLKNSPISLWYSVIEIKNPEHFLLFLAQEKFIKQEKNIYKKEYFTVKIVDDKCIISTGDTKDFSHFNLLSRLVQQDNSEGFYKANQFIEGSHGSFSHISEGKITSFPIVLEENSIILKSENLNTNFADFIENLQQKPQTLHVELDEKNINLFKKISKEENSDSLQINKIHGIATVELVNDTIVSYEFDDNFNEVKKETYQKILQPNYRFGISTNNPETIWKYFQQKKWINAQNEFTAIPFLPNSISQTDKELQIVSTRKKIETTAVLNKNFLFYRSNPLFVSNLQFVSEKEKRFLSNIDYVFYGNQNEDYFLEIRLKKQKLPFILRLL